MCPPTVPILSLLDPFHTPTSHFLKIHLNTVLRSTAGSPKGVSFSQVSQPISCIRLSSPPFALHVPPISLSSPPFALHVPPISFFLDLITLTILGDQYRSLSSSLCSFLHSLVISSFLGPNIPLNTLFSNTLSLRSSLNVNDQVSHP